MKKVDDLGGPVSLAARKKKTKTSAEYRRKGRGKEAKNLEGLRRRQQERRLYDETVVKVCFLEHY
jgi:hypothetical protein